VAHGLNDPLTSVVGLVTLARKSAGADTEAGKMLATALAEARRVTGVIHDLRRLAAPGLAQGARRFTLDRPVDAAVERLKETATERGVEVTVSQSAGLPPMEGDPEQIEALVGRLLENALVSTPAGGRVTISTSAVDGAALRLVVADTGAGFPPALRDRIFDPFFSPTGERGAGLGLSLAHGIVSAHHGRIQADAEPGRGATFTVHFPAAPVRPTEA
jgi:signal transduction histidine kinase